MFGKWGVREKPISGELTRINKINIEGYKVKLEKAGGGVFYEEKVLTSNIKGYGSGRINLNNKKYFVKLAYNFNVFNIFKFNSSAFISPCI